MEVVPIPTRPTRSEEISQRILKWSEANLRIFPWRENRTPYRIMVAEFLLKRTTARAADRVYQTFLEKYPNITELSKAEVCDLEVILSTLGYHKLRSRAIKETAVYVVKHYSARLPTDLIELLSIPNIGHYTAGAIMSLGHGKRAQMVDSNVERVIIRMFKNSVPDKVIGRWVRETVDGIIPDIKHDRFNLALIDLGATVCTYRACYCERCPVGCVCDTYNKGF